MVELLMSTCNLSNLTVAFFILIALLGGFVIGHANNSETKAKKKNKIEKQKFLKKQKYLLENLLDEVDDELNATFKATSRGVNIFTGTTFRYRVYVMYKVSFKKDKAVVKFYLGNGEEACEDGPEISFDIDLRVEIDDALQEAITSKVYRRLVARTNYVS